MQTPDVSISREHAAHTASSPDSVTVRCHETNQKKSLATDMCQTNCCLACLASPQSLAFARMVTQRSAGLVLSDAVAYGCDSAPDPGIPRIT